MSRSRRAAVGPIVLATFLLSSLVVGGCRSESTDERPAEMSADGESSELADEIHRDVLVLDAHADIELPDAPSAYVGADGRSRVAPDKLRRGGVDAVVLTAGVGPGPRDAAGYEAAWTRVLRELDAAQALAAAPDSELIVVRSVEELVTAEASDRTAIVLGVQNALALGRDPERIDALFARGVRVFALTHMGHNDFADSSRPLWDAATAEREPDAEHGGLSDLGRLAIERVNWLGGVVDVSQLSRAATLEAIERSASPVIASHSNVQALTRVSRNLSDEELDRIGESGGVVHVTPFRGYLFDSGDAELDRAIRSARRDAGLPEDALYPFELYWELQEPERGEFVEAISQLLGSGSIDAMLDHLDYVVERIGIDHVGIGTDFNHGGGVQDFAEADEAPNVTRALIERGYDEDAIRKIWGGNFVRVWRASEAAAAAE